MRLEEIKVKRSLREVLPPKSGRVAMPPPLPPRMARARDSRSPRRRRIIWAIAIIVVLGLVIFLGTMALARVTVEVTPKVITLPLSDTLTLSREDKGLDFDVITLPSATANKVVKVSGVEKVSRPASGQIVVYNNFSSASQQLITNTRFQAKNGKIYRIREAITVPGTKTVAGKVTPGSVEATVYADEPGPEYNGEATDFTIPGFKGDPRFDKFFARSKTALSGGFIGDAPKLSAEEEAQARAQLRADLTKDLLAEARSKIPASFVLLDSLTLLDIKDVADFGLSDNGSTATLKQSATLQGLMLPRVGLVDKLVGARVPGFAPSDLEISNLADLHLAFSSSPTGDLSDKTTFTLQVSGSIALTPAIDPLDLATKLAGAKKNEIDSIVSRVKGLEKIKVIYRPPWLLHIPADSNRIDVKLPGA